MGIDGVTNQTVSLYRQAVQTEDKPQAKPAPAVIGASEPTEDYIDLKAIKAILYLGIKGDVYLPLDQGQTFNTFA